MDFLSFSATDSTSTELIPVNEKFTGFRLPRFLGRGSEETPYNDPSYDGDEIFHNEGDKLRLGCKLGYDNKVGKPFTAAECICETRASKIVNLKN